MNLKEVPDEAIHAALIQSEGDFEIAAALVSKDTTASGLRKYVNNRPQLRAIFAKNAGKQEDLPTEADQMMRDKLDDIDDTSLAVRESFESTMQMMEDVGVKTSVVDKMKRMNQGKVNNAAFLMTSLSMTQQMMSYHVMKLMERMDDLETRIDDPKTPDKSKVQLQYLWNACSDLLGKHNDRLLNATATLYRLGSRKKSGKGKGEKPGYSTYDTIDVN